MMYKLTKTYGNMKLYSFGKDTVYRKKLEKAIGSEYNSKMLAKRVKVRCCIFINFESVCKAVKYKQSQVLKKRTCKARAISLQNHATLLFSFPVFRL